MALKLDQFVQELYAEKRWLDLMIRALDIATRSPAHSLVWTLARSLGEAKSARSVLLLEKKKKVELERLAEKVRGRGPKLPPRQRPRKGPNIVLLTPAKRRKIIQNLRVEERLAG